MRGPRGSRLVGGRGRGTLAGARRWRWRGRAGRARSRSTSPFLGPGAGTWRRRRSAVLGSRQQGPWGRAPARWHAGAAGPRPPHDPGPTPAPPPTGLPRWARRACCVHACPCVQAGLAATGRRPPPLPPWLGVFGGGGGAAAGAAVRGAGGWVVGCLRTARRRGRAGPHTPHCIPYASMPINCFAFTRRRPRAGWRGTRATTAAARHAPTTTYMMKCPVRWVFAARTHPTQLQCVTMCAYAFSSRLRPQESWPAPSRGGRRPPAAGPRPRDPLGSRAVTALRGWFWPDLFTPALAAGPGHVRVCSPADDHPAPGRLCGLGLAHCPLFSAVCVASRCVRGAFPGGLTGYFTAPVELPASLVLAR